MTEHLRRASVEMAAGIDRRRFLRRVAGTTFAGMAAFAAGGIPGLRVGVARAFPAACLSAGPGCPSNYGCGPSQCCNRAGRPSGCNCCLAPPTWCRSGTTHCRGKAPTWGGQSCWTCRRSTRTTTCCDCRTVSCGDSSGRCICYRSTVTAADGTIIEDSDSSQGVTSDDGALVGATASEG